MWGCISFPATCAHSDQDDFESFLKESGLTYESVEKAKQQMDSAGLLPKSIGVEIKESGIEGLGAFAEQSEWQGTAIGAALIYGKWTSLGRYTNHARHANTRPSILDNGTIFLIASRPVKAGEEITVNYRDMKEALLTIKTEAEVKTFVSA